MTSLKSGVKLDLMKKLSTYLFLIFFSFSTISYAGTSVTDYTLFIEEDGEDFMIVYRYPDAKLKGTIIYDTSSEYSKFFKDVYSDSNTITFIQPMELNSDGDMEDYMLPEYKLDEFIYRFLIREDHYILEFESKVGLQRIISFLNSKITFSISTTDNIFWHASTYKALNSIDDYKLLAKTNPSTICKILSEPLILNLKNKELGTHKIIDRLNNQGIQKSTLGCD